MVYRAIECAHLAVPLLLALAITGCHCHDVRPEMPVATIGYSPDGVPSGYEKTTWTTWEDHVAGETFAAEEILPVPAGHYEEHLTPATNAAPLSAPGEGRSSATDEGPSRLMYRLPPMTEPQPLH